MSNTPALFTVPEIWYAEIGSRYYCRRLCPLRGPRQPIESDMKRLTQRAQREITGSPYTTRRRNSATPAARASATHSSSDTTTTHRPGPGVTT